MWLKLLRRHRRERQNLHERCVAKLAEVPNPQPFNEITFPAAVEKQRGRRLLLIPLGVHHFKPDTDGLALSLLDGDLICFDGSATGLRRLLIIVHECCHLLWGHVTSQPYAVAEIITDISMERLHSMFGGTGAGGRLAHRAGYNTQQEQEAEYLARLSLYRAGQTGQRQAPDLNPEGQQLLVALSTSLGNIQ